MWVGKFSIHNAIVELDEAWAVLRGKRLGPQSFAVRLLCNTNESSVFQIFEHKALI